jgi:hypothetical protein
VDLGLGADLKNTDLFYLSKRVGEETSAMKCRLSNLRCETRDVSRVVTMGV